MKLFIISNRLPVKAVCNDGVYSFTPSEGGLATGLDSLHTDYEKHWIGWPGMYIEDPDARAKVTEELEKMNFHPIFLSPDEIENYYEGYSNSTIWPLCHYFFAYTHYSQQFSDAYRQVNRMFYQEACRIISEDDIVWVQDYQLMLLPAMLREAMPSASIGYFHHIPFPSYELFRILPERTELLRGILGADLVAFHTYEYAHNFIETAEQVLHVDFKLDEVQIDNRYTRVDALPMGIDYDKFHRAARNETVQNYIAKTREHFGDHKLILSVDRLDYSKGILHRLRGFASLLRQHPEYRGKVTLDMVIVPSRDKVDSYADLKTSIDKEISAINGKYATIDWTPVCYFYHGFSFEELTAMYYVADIALVTPLRDGMNLVAKEYVAVKDGNPGVLILSEMAGASAELTDAIPINPNDTQQIASALDKALKMPVDEQLRRLNAMQKVISTQTVNKWARDFMDELHVMSFKNTEARKKQVTPSVIADIEGEYTSAQQRLLIFDYDGTLAPICQRPEDAAPTPQLLDVLRKLAEDPANHVVVSSGRDHDTLDRWLGQLPISLAAEHGAFYKEHGQWVGHPFIHEWPSELLTLLNTFVAKTPRSHIEYKQTALVWHYRRSDNWLGTLRAQQLIELLTPLCPQWNLQIMPGSKVVEIKSPRYTKGSETRRLFQQADYDFVLAMGDDTTDDDMFRALPREAISIKIGEISDCARYYMPRQQEVIPLLEALAGSGHGSAAQLRQGIRSVWSRLKKMVTNKKSSHVQ